MRALHVLKPISKVTGPRRLALCFPALNHLNHKPRGLPLKKEEKRIKKKTFGVDTEDRLVDCEHEEMRRWTEEITSSYTNKEGARRSAFVLQTMCLPFQSRQGQWGFTN